MATNNVLQITFHSLWAVHVHNVHDVHNSVSQENSYGNEDGSAAEGGEGGLKEFDPSQERRRCSRVRWMKQVFLIFFVSCY